VTLNQSNNCHFSGRFCTLQRIIHNSQCTDPHTTNLVKMCFTKSSSSCKNLSFIWLISCYQISILSQLLYAKNCGTIADKIHFKTEASLIQLSWNSYNILHHKSRACIPNFMPIQIDLITQTWLRSLLTQILWYRTDFNHLSILHQIESNLESTCLNTFTRHKSIQSTLLTLLKVIS
jgi:hypothetical protein